MQRPHLVVSFKRSAKPRPVDRLFQEEVERFAAADPRWRTALEMAASRLGPRARSTLGVALSGVEAGPAPWPMSFDFDPDDEDGILRERVHMSPRLVAGLDLLDAGRLGLDPYDVAVIRGIVSAVHRRLRIAKTRP